MLIVISRRREPCLYANMFQFKFGVIYTTSYLNVAHLYD